MADITFHYTNPQMVKDLLALLNFKSGDKILDVGSGRNKVWYKNLPEDTQNYECEIEDGIDFLRDWKAPVDWIIGNPPYKIGKDILMHSLDLAEKGIAFLINLNGLNSFFLPSRLAVIFDKGFTVSKIHVVQDRRWFGRYFFVVFEKNSNESGAKISFNPISY